MSVAGRLVARHLKRLRDREGSTLSLRGVDYPCITEAVAGAKVGTQTLPHTLGPYIASADPRVFSLSPQHFVPYTAVLPPEESEVLHWHELKYLITAVTYDDTGNDTNAIQIFAYREIYG